MSSSRSYMVRALYEWIVDNDCTPYVLVNANAADVIVPQQYVKNGQIVLNISPSAVVALHMDNQAMSFNGRFAGAPMDLYIPMSAVMGIYARENGQGMVFDIEPEPTPDPKPPAGGSKTATKLNKKPSLKVVK